MQDIAEHHIDTISNSSTASSDNDRILALHEQAQKLAERLQQSMPTDGAS